MSVVLLLLLVLVLIVLLKDGTSHQWPSVSWLSPGTPGALSNWSADASVMRMRKGVLISEFNILQCFLL